MFQNFGKIQNFLDLLLKVLSVAGVVHSTIQHVVDQFKPAVAPAPASVPAPPVPAAAAPAPAAAASVEAFTAE